MQRDDRAFLFDMLDSAREAVTIADGETLAKFEGDRLRQLSLLKLIEIVGEAANQVRDETRKAPPNIPWKDVIDMRHRLVHGYFDIDYQIVWKTVVEDLPSLISMLEPIVYPKKYC